MSPRKLTEDDKQNMLELYRNSKATTSTLASEFGVSSSTVSRFLKNSLSQEEYEELIQQKRLARTPRGDRQKTEAVAQEVQKVEEKPSQKIILPIKNDKVETKEAEKKEKEPEIISPSTTVRRRRRSSVKAEEAEDTQELNTEDVSIEDTTTEKPLEIKKSSQIKLQTKVQTEILPENEDDEDEDEDDVDVAVLSAMLGEEIDDEDEDEDEDDVDDNVDDDELEYPHTSSSTSDLEILPLSAASFPRTCYLVVDRAAELIVKPLQEFADLGTIPDEEIQQKTLPVFDNHRIAKRFSHRREKVIKVPDGKMLQKTSPYLYEKGITRLLIRGQIYAISKSQ
ncbi:conserved hypothetical protein [Hyella patelloides LEGE 07179]|uniref:Transposase n=1 Tax=Hyella patelloides LEGE 07179 TaxID=945734 RepID=A0A563W2I6_9CYAN|nr:hypothetical protein [Hyella patelloides]VEP17753.1 conserved hypothetical protein [Hyella patelloides LEGE 07179]